ncbi:alcohol dehydrogenase catalytic domain-containing protein [Rahnella sp. CG8]|uniref:alcohol dehydrogenase catalytic domain-containing protein n=1 Tax=Rahnella sp. CG8 TaxID=2726078 RepID=UPI0020344CC3|nr:alcohol dehydrogenase catalytic domain-containing protein [Rahnella sp. CG8]MCM2444984.1 alcohol dehydrogenase catalytic domain-containing protein [Rahnella sp. CG8]
MKAIKLYGKEDIRIVEIPTPKISGKEILLKVEAAGICGTDIKNWKHGHKYFDAEHPVTMGHEVSGKITKVGKEVPFYKEGMRVAIAPNIGCGICDICVSGNTHMCVDSHKAFGINIDGAFAEYMVITEDAIAQGNLVVIPDTVSPEDAAMNEPLSCAYNGVAKCNVKAGDIAIVIGAGPIGLMIAMLLKMLGASKVILNDISEDRLREGEKLVPGVLTYCGDNLYDFVMKHTDGKGVDIALTATPVAQVQNEVLRLMNYFGRINYFGLTPADKQPVPVDTNLIHSKELSVVGTTKSSISQFRKTLEFVSSGLLPVNSVVTHEYSIDNGLEAFENAWRGKGLKHIIRF